MHDAHPPIIAVREAVARALAEDLTPLGDLTSALLPPALEATARFVPRADGILAGRLCAMEAFRQVDPLLEVAWWADVMGGDIEHEPTWSSLQRVPGMPFEYLVFGSVPEAKTIKNRVHWDVTAATPDAVDDLVRRGATLLREPTESEGWHVLADPEGNEFCLFPSAGT